MSNETDIDKPQAETEQVPWIGIIIIITAVFGLCTVTFLGSYFGVRALVTQGIDKRSNYVGHPELNLLQEKENAIMTEYKKLDGGKIRIPISRAMQLIVSEAVVTPEEPVSAVIETLTAPPAETAKPKAADSSEAAAAPGPKAQESVKAPEKAATENAHSSRADQQRALRDRRMPPIAGKRPERRHAQLP